MTQPPEILTFGCRLNHSESAVIARHAAEAGRTNLVIVNTCAVTAEAERQAAQAIRRVARDRPAAQIVVTGCAAQIAPARYAAMPAVARVLGNRDKLSPEIWRETGGPRVQVGAPGGDGAPMPFAPAVPAGERRQTRALLQVQSGCDHRCTFCIIPFGRGPSRSLPPDQAVARARDLVEAGYREIVLTGVDLTAWGQDLAGRPRLGQLVRQLLTALPGLPRLRLSSVDPAEIDPELWRCLAEEPRLMPYLHLSLQAGDDLVLKRMKRRHTAAQARAAIAEARRLRPDIAIGADLIAGFPTESDRMFESTLSLVHDAAMAHLHVFPYSPRPGTPAARMPQVPDAVRRERAARLRAAGAASAAAFLATLVGRSATVLMERGGLARTPHFAPVRLDRGIAPGSLVAADLTGSDGAVLSGRVRAAA